MNPELLFQGVMRPSTPSGRITTSAVPALRVKSYCSSTSAALSKTLAAWSAIQRERETGAPYSSITASVSSSARALTASCIRRSMAMRSALSVLENVHRRALRGSNGATRVLGIRQPDPADDLGSGGVEQIEQLLAVRGCHSLSDGHRSLWRGG